LWGVEKETSWGKELEGDQEDPMVPPEKMLGLEPSRQFDHSPGLGARQKVQGLGFHR
jgi:hypothetical protein